MRNDEIQQQAPVDDNLPVSALPPWYEAESAVQEQPWLTSSTDLLVAWHPEPVIAGAPHATDWDRYFHPASTAMEMARVETITIAAEPWDHNAASCVVDSLYRFLRALETMNTDEAMECVSAGYHAIEEHREMDRDALRLKLDAMVDSWRGDELRISLTEIPDPIFHPSGVIVHVTLQADHRDKSSGELKTSLLPYLIWFTEDRQHLWLIRSMMAVR